MLKKERTSTVAKPSILCEKQADKLIVRIPGEIDHHSSRRLRERMDEEIVRRPVERVRFELSDVKFMDSAGLGLILGRLAVAREVGCTLLLTGADARMRRIFDMAGLERVKGLTLEA